MKIVEITYWDAVSGAEIRDGTLAAIALTKKHEACLGLLDCSAQTETASIMDLFEQPTLYEEEGLTRKVQIALVEPLRRELHELAAFYENVCVNRAWSVRRFLARDEALTWLLSREVSNPAEN